MRLTLFPLLVILGACAAPATPGPAGPLADAALSLDAEPSLDAATIADAPSVVDAPASVDAPAAEVAADAALSEYPAAPYGNTVGSVLADLRWEGFVNEAHEEISTGLTFGPTTMGAVRATGAPFALVHLSGFL